MIYATKGAASPYYAGLTLVLMVLAVVLDWTFWQSVVSVVLVLLLYLAACLFSPVAFDKDTFISNLFFLVSSGIAIIAGTYFHSRVRVREFVSRSELDKSRKALEVSLQQLKENEMQLVQSEKLSSLGRMSAGIIHEINNPLNFSTTGLFALRKKGKKLAPEERSEYDDIVNDIEEGIKRVRNIVSDLRTFTHPGGGTGEPVAWPKSSMRRCVFSAVNGGTTCKSPEVPPDLRSLWANRNKLIHVLVNLLQNAIDALPEKTFADGEKPTIWIDGRVENRHGQCDPSATTAQA